MRIVTVYVVNKFHYPAQGLRSSEIKVMFVGSIPFMDFAEAEKCAIEYTHSTSKPIIRDKSFSFRSKDYAAVIRLHEVIQPTD